MKERTRKFLERLDQLDEEADREIGDGVVPWEDIVEIALKEFHADSHNAALDLAQTLVSDIGEQHRDYDQSRDSRPLTDEIRSSIKTMMIIYSNEPM